MLLAVGLVAGLVLALQVLLTRLFSAVLFYHFGFLAISLALLGTGAGGLLLYVRPERFRRASSELLLARWSAVLAGLLVVVPLVLVRLDYHFTGHVTASFALALAAACLLAALPFTAAGIVIALAIRDYSAHTGRVYAADLGGAALGAFAVVPALWLLPPAALMVALGGLAALATALFGWRHRPERIGGAAGVGLAVGAVAISTVSSLYHLPPYTRGHPVSDRWTPLSRVLGYAPSPGAPFALLFYDRVYAPVPVHRPGTPYPAARALHLVPQSIGYGLEPRGRSLVIGGGGGRDIYNALSSGQRRVDVIELNRGIVDTVDGDLGRWSGSPYSLPGVSTAVGDGRSVLARRSTRYDEIHIGFTDTLSANSATAFALSEANLYTVEAFDEYYDHLGPNGILNVSRLYKLVGDEALRTTVLALQSLERRGVRHPERNVVVLLGRDVFGELFGTVLSRPRPWTPAELARVRAAAARERVDVAYAPGGPYRLEWARLARAPSAGSFCSSYRLNVCAPTDDRPFFFNMRRLGDVGRSQPPGYIYSIDPLLVLLLTLAVLAALSLLAFVLPIVLMRGGRRPPVAPISFFAAIGLGFLLLEVVLIQRFVLFLGFPTYALSVVLFALLLCTGAGALLSTRFAAAPRRALLVALGAVTVVIVAAAFGLQPLLRALIDLPFAARVAMSVALLAPVAVGMGMAMPIGLRRLGALYPDAIPWAWAVNGVASVVASVLAVAIAIAAGFTVATLVAAACYLGALVHGARGRWPEPASGVDPEPLVAPTRVDTLAPGR